MNDRKSIKGEQDWGANPQEGGSGAIDVDFTGVIEPEWDL